MINQKKLLINTPSLKLLGGVSNHFMGLNNYWNFKINYCYVGSRNGINGILLLPIDVLKFCLKIVFFQPDYILINPSLQLNALKRDAVFLSISKLFKKNTAIFFHGWDIEIEKLIDNDNYDLLKNYNKADMFFVLASSFKHKLEEWGFKQPINLTTTKVDDLLVSDFKVEKKMITKSILFLARIEKQKGIYIVLKTYKKLKEKHKDLSLTIVGDGNELTNVKKYINENKLNDVKVTGRLSGQSLKDVFINNSLYFFPTYHGEGMPTSLLESMAFGLTIVSRPVGGISDFFKSEMGGLTESKDPEVYFNILNNYLTNENLLKEISIFNHKYAMRNFLASNVVQCLEKHLSKI